MQDDFPTLAPSWFGRGLKSKTGDRDQQQSSAWNSRAAYQSSGSTWKGCGPASLRWNRADDDAAGKNSADHSFSAHHSSSTVREYKPWMSKGTDAGKESANSYSNHRLDTRAGSDKQGLAGTLSVVDRNEDFPALTHQKQPKPTTTGYAPREAPYKSTFLAANSARWTSALADAPPVSLDGPIDSSSAHTRQQDEQGSPQRSAHGAALLAPAASSDWKSIAASAAPGDAADNVSQSDMDKIKEQLEAKQARLLPRVGAAASGSRTSATAGSGGACRGVFGGLSSRTAAQVLSTPSTGSHMVPLTHAKPPAKPTHAPSRSLTSNKWAPTQLSAQPPAQQSPTPQPQQLQPVVAGHAMNTAAGAPPASDAWHSGRPPVPHPAEAEAAAAMPARSIASAVQAGHGSALSTSDKWAAPGLTTMQGTEASGSDGGGAACLGTNAPDSALPTDQEAAFLKSLGWDGESDCLDTGDADCEALTEAEIAAFKATSAPAAPTVQPARGYSPPLYGPATHQVAGILPWVPSVPGPPLRVVPVKEGKVFMACISAPTSSPIAVLQPVPAGLVAPPNLSTLFATSIGTHPLLSDSDDD